MKADIVARAAQRLIDMRMEKPDGEEAVVTVSALDLEPGASASPYAAGRLDRSIIAQAEVTAERVPKGA
jgi:hypothetical protein